MLAREAVCIEVENIAEDSEAAKGYQLYPAIHSEYIGYMSPCFLWAIVR